MRKCRVIDYNNSFTPAVSRAFYKWTDEMGKLPKVSDRERLYLLAGRVARSKRKYKYVVKFKNRIIGGQKLDRIFDHLDGDGVLHPKGGDPC